MPSRKAATATNSVMPYSRGNVGAENDRAIVFFCISRVLFALLSDSCGVTKTNKLNTNKNNIKRRSKNYRRIN